MNSTDSCFQFDGLNFDSKVPLKAKNIYIILSYEGETQYLLNLRKANCVLIVK